MQLLDTFKDWFLNLSENHGVNPYIFGGIYVGAIPFFFLCLGWTIKNLRRKKPIIVPVMLTGLFLISAYLYLLIAGRNIPVWVYFFIAALIIYGLYSIAGKIKSKSKAV